MKTNTAWVSWISKDTLDAQALPHIYLSYRTDCMGNLRLAPVVFVCCFFLYRYIIKKNHLSIYKEKITEWPNKNFEFLKVEEIILSEKNVQ